MMLTRDDIDCNKREISSLLLETKREGIENIIQYLEESGFYDAPSSVLGYYHQRQDCQEHG